MSHICYSKVRNRVLSKWVSGSLAPHKLCVVAAFSPWFFKWSSKHKMMRLNWGMFEKGESLVFLNYTIFINRFFSANDNSEYTRLTCSPNKVCQTHILFPHHSSESNKVDRSFPRSSERVFVNPLRGIFNWLNLKS